MCMHMHMCMCNMCTTQAYRHELGQPLEVELDRLDLKLARREGRHLAYHSK